MGLFDFLKRPDLERGLAQFSQTPGAVLLDVRTPEEFAAGHIPESQNIPLHMLGQAGQLPDSLETPPVCLLPERRQEPSGGRIAPAGGLFPCDRSGRYLSLSRKGGQMR